MEGRHERERLRAERQAAESQDAAAQLARKRRVQLLSLAAFGAAAVIVALIIVISQSGGSDSNGGGGNPGNVTGVAEVNSELNGIPQSGQTLGQQSAPVTVTEFGDPQCPVCAEFSRRIAPALISSEVKGGTAKYVYEPFLIIGPDSKPAMRAALAAGEQNRFWNYLQLFYANQGEENSGYVTDDFLTSIAKAAGVDDIDKWNTSRNSSQWDSVIQQGSSQADSFDFNGTPSLVVQGPKGTQALKGFSEPELRTAINNQVS